jgi:hypothetical protein
MRRTDSTRLRLAPPADVALPAPVDRGRMLTPDDVVAMLPARANGKRYSRKWIRDEFLRAKRHKLGALVYWWQADVESYLAAPEQHDAA